MKQEYPNPWEQDTYQTGSTRPPKSHKGLLAFLMVLVIFLCGISTALGLMNIRLLDALKSSQEETSPVAFSGSSQEESADDVSFLLGFCGQEIPEFWCVYQDLPRGIYITTVDADTDAAEKGVQPGDILTGLDGEEITTADQLTSLLEKKEKPVQATFFRNGKQIELTLKPTKP